jgi:hypothetical protein
VKLPACLAAAVLSSLLKNAFVAFFNSRHERRGAAVASATTQPVELFNGLRSRLPVGHVRVALK